MATKELTKTWRQNNKERYNQYMREYNRRRNSEIRRKIGYGDKKCRLCEIMLASTFGGHKKKFYCDDCVQRGDAKKHFKKLYDTKRYQLKKLKYDTKI